MAYPNISDFYWKAICNSMLIQYMCDYYVKRFTQVFWTSYRRERISIRHTMEKSSKRMKKAMFTFWQFVKKWTLPLQKQHTLTETKNFLLVGQLWEKKHFWLVRWYFSKAFLSSLLTNYLLRVKRNKSFCWRFAYLIVFWKDEKMCLVKEISKILVEKRVCHIVTIGCWRKHIANFFNATNELNDFGPNILIISSPFSSPPTECWSFDICVHKRQTRDIVDIAFEANWRQT